MGKRRRFKHWNNHNQNTQPRKLLNSKCTECGIEFTPPFNPEGMNNVFCENCFIKLSQEMIA